MLKNPRCIYTDIPQPSAMINLYPLWKKECSLVQWFDLGLDSSREHCQQLEIITIIINYNFVKQTINA